MKPILIKKYIEFEKTVKALFEFLEKDYGFHIEEIKQSKYVRIIRYESPLVFVNLVYGPPSYEPEISFGRIGVDDMQGGRSFSVGDLLGLEYYSEWNWGDVDQSNSRLLEIISGFACLFKKRGSGCLRGDGNIYEKMAVKRRVALNQWRKDETTRQAREAAEVAWNSKNYNEIVRLYQSMSDLLTEMEKKKLKYARKIISS
jgi:hypothetical protein